MKSCASNGRHKRAFKRPTFLYVSLSLSLLLNVSLGWSWSMGFLFVRWFPTSSVAAAGQMAKIFTALLCVIALIRTIVRRARLLLRFLQRRQALDLLHNCRQHRKRCRCNSHSHQNNKKINNNNWKNPVSNFENQLDAIRQCNDSSAPAIFALQMIKC